MNPQLSKPILQVVAAISAGVATWAVMKGSSYAPAAVAWATGAIVGALQV